MSRSGPIALLVAAFLLAGCANYSSFPPLEGQESSADATQAPVPEVIATAIEWCVAREDYRVQEQPVDFALPAGMPAETHDAVSTQLVEDGFPRGLDASESTNPIRVRSVRLFGLKAMVDLSVPRSNGFEQLVTLELRSYPFQSWYVVAANRWRFNEDQLRRTQTELSQASTEPAP